MIPSRANVCSNQAADMLSAFTAERADQASHRPNTHIAASPTESACSRSRGIQPANTMQQMPPTVAGMTTNDTMNGSSMAKYVQGECRTTP